MIKSIIFCTLYAMLNVSGAAIIKWKLANKSLSKLSDWFDFLFQIPVILAFGIIFFSALVMFKALSTGNFSLTIPLATGINFMFTIIVGYFLFKDTINTQTILGFLLIIAGIIIISLNQGQHAK